MNQQIQKTTVKGTLKRDDKILFVKDTKGIWELPGGRIDFGENPEETLKREFKEELGWDNVKVGNTINAWSFTSQKEDVDYQFIVLVYECFSEEKYIKYSDEHIEYKWIPISGVNELNMRDGYKNSVRKFLSGLDK
ncbi:MAG: NUDIX hydrolase [Patescibacteria group bacterium]